VKRQGEIVAYFQEQGAASDVAIALLAEFEELQRQHLAHLARLEGGT
jgi:hypothetical protein